MNELPNLAGIATADLVEKLGGGSFSASYINWSRTMQLLRQHAPGWMPALMNDKDGNGPLHRAPIGAYLVIGFHHMDGRETMGVPQAIMDNKNNAIPYDKITARDITDTHRRGVCMAAAFTFGLAYELWAKLPLESGYAAPEAAVSGNPTTGVMEGLDAETQAWLTEEAEKIGIVLREQSPAAAKTYIDSLNLATEEKVGLWTLFDSKQRSAMKAA